MDSSESGRTVCPSCGEAAHGNFCSACGAQLVGNRKSSLEDLPAIGEPIALARTFWRVTRSPFSEPLRLSTLPSDKSPYKFLLVGVGMFVGFFLTMEALANAWHVAGFTAEQKRFLSFAQYAILIRLTLAAVIVYAAFAISARRRVSLGSHVRLWALLSGYYLAAETIFLVTVVTAYVVVYFGAPAVAPTALSILSVALMPVFLVILILLLVNLIVVQAHQWSKPLWTSAAIFALALIATHVLAPPIQTAIMSAISGAEARLGMTPFLIVPY